MGKFGALRDKYATTSEARKFIPSKFKTGIPEEDEKAPFILLAPYGISNKRWSAAQNAINRKDKEKLDAGQLSNEKARAITLDTFLAACPEGWGNIADESGAPIEFSAKNVRELFSDPGMSELYLEALEFARNMDNYLVAEANAVAGNS